MGRVKNDIFPQNGAVVLDRNIEAWARRAYYRAITIHMKDTTTIIHYGGIGIQRVGHGVAFLSVKQRVLMELICVIIG